MKKKGKFSAFCLYGFQVEHVRERSQQDLLKHILVNTSIREERKQKKKRFNRGAEWGLENVYTTDSGCIIDWAV